MSKIAITVATVATLLVLSSFSFHNDAAIEAQKVLFKAWMLKYGKSYSTHEEFLYRLGKFAANAKFVGDHNARHAIGLESYDVELNMFADLDTLEFSEKYLMRNFKVTKNCTGPQPSTSNLPEAIDWTVGSSVAVTPIKNQGQCGSCWAFSTTGSVEGAYFLKNNKLESFSEQQLVDCSHAYGNNGCNGGLMDDAFYYIIDNGLTTEAKYPYKGVGGTCKYTSADKATGLSNCADVTVDKELALQAAVAQQPVSVAIEANHLSFQLYKSGVYSGNCGTNLDHGVLAAGYGTESGKKFWKVKNSWGSSWGLNGFILIERTGDGKGKCGINMAASFPIL